VGFVPRAPICSPLKDEMYSIFKHTSMILDGVTTTSANDVPAIPFEDSCEEPIAVGAPVISYHRNEAYVLPTEFHVGTEPTSEYVRDGFRMSVPLVIFKAISSPNAVSIWLNAMISPTVAVYPGSVCGEPVAIEPRV
jgi:hypothetical protein